MPMQESLWRNRRYGFLLSAQAISSLGDWLYILAMLMMVGVKWHGSPMMVSLVMICVTAPTVLLGPISGVFADRWNRTVIMMVSNLVMAALVGTIPFLTHHWMVYVVLILMSSFEALFSPAESAKVKEIVDDDHMQKAISTNSAMQQMTKVIGPGLSGILVSSFGVESAFNLDAVSFVVATLLLFGTGFRPRRTIRAVSTMANTVAAESNDSVGPSDEAVGQIVTPSQKRSNEGWKHIRRTPILFTGTVVTLVVMLVLQLVDSQLVTVLRLIPNMSANLFGYAMASSGIGAFIGAISVGRTKWNHVATPISLATMVLGVAFVTIIGTVQFGWTQWLILPVAAIAGATSSFIFIPFNTMAQTQTPVHLTGRVFGIIGSAISGAAMAGPLVAGGLLVWLGVFGGMYSASLVLIAVGITVFLSQRFIRPLSVTGPQTNSEASVEEFSTPL